MSIPVYSILDFQGNEIQNYSYEKLATAPSGYNGRVYLDTVLNKIGVYINSAWQYFIDETAIQSLINSAVTGLFDDRGNYDASTNLFPATGGSGTAGAILKGDIWLISVAGTLGTQDVEVGDSVRALTDAPGQTEANWSISQTNIALDNQSIYKNGSGKIAIKNYVTSFVVADFVAGVLTITQATHGLPANENLTVIVKNASGAEVITETAVGSSGTVTITPTPLFDGTVIIKP